MSVTTRAQMQRTAVTAEPGLAETDSENAHASEMHRSTSNASDQDAAMRLREKELDLEMLRMQIQLQTLRLQEQGIHESEGGRRVKLSSYAKDLRAVLPTMPETDDLAPAWFKSAETMLRSCDIPQDAAGAIIIPFLNEKSRTLVANKSEDRVLSYDEVRELVLSELKLTPEEYKRRFYACRKGKESWGQCVTKLEITLDYYLRSRKVESLEEFRALIISDRAKELMSHELCAYVLQHETGDWFKPMKKTWTGKWAPPTGLNKAASEYLITLRQQMAEAAQRVDDQATEMQRAYASKYNLRAREKTFNIDEEVLVFDVNQQSKMQPKWVGPAKIKEKKRQDSYIVRFQDGTERWIHANRLRRYHARVNNVGVIFECDEELGEVNSIPDLSDETGNVRLAVDLEQYNLTTKKYIEKIVFCGLDTVPDIKIAWIGLHTAFKLLG
ncbi:hypothetical protein MTO96_032053 [Rhipicephalus appendiculatus]